MCERTPSRRARLAGQGSRSIQGMPRRGWMTHKPLACREESICRRAVSILHQRMLRPGDSHSRVAKSANHPLSIYAVLFFFNDTATTEIYTLSLHDALPI